MIRKLGTRRQDFLTQQQQFLTSGKFTGFLLGNTPLAAGPARKFWVCDKIDEPTHLTVSRAASTGDSRSDNNVRSQRKT